MNPILQKLYKIKKYKKVLDKAPFGSLIVIEGKTNGAFFKRLELHDKTFFWDEVTEWIVVEKDL